MMCVMAVIGDRALNAPAHPLTAASEDTVSLLSGLVLLAHSLLWALLLTVSLAGLVPA